ncbi:MAG: L-threonylcarbamoyladenylate synthase [Kiritimatiellae bacterium]|nr:L-threonylcarbamoyladenylate synthase [Kiritimatiellia bacterium]
MTHIQQPILKVTAENAIGEAADVLRRGGLVVLPTDTVYGLAADPRVPGARERIRKAKHRDAEKPLAYLAASLDAVSAFGASINERERRLADAFWPGALTLVLRMQADRAESSSEEEGFRVPDTVFTRTLLETLDSPLLVTSANTSGTPPALTIEAALEQLGNHADLYLDDGTSPGGEASSVVRASGSSMECLREAALSLETLSAVAES